MRLIVSLLPKKVNSARPGHETGVRQLAGLGSYGGALGQVALS
jgi:hypothetical protein